MTEQTIALPCELYQNEILILRTVHRIEPISYRFDDNTKYLIFKFDESINRILVDVRQIEDYVNHNVDPLLDILREYLFDQVQLTSHSDTSKLEEIE